MVHTQKLKGRIMAAGYTQASLAPLVDMSKNALNAKINGKSRLYCDEVDALCTVLGIVDTAEKCEFLKPNIPIIGRRREFAWN